VRVLAAWTARLVGPTAPGRQRDRREAEAGADLVDDGADPLVAIEERALERIESQEADSRRRERLARARRDAIPL